MANDTIKVRSSIKSTLMRSIIMRGTFLAILGAAILLYAGVFLSLDALSILGLPLLLFSGGLLTLGLLPYRKLTSLEKKPDELVMDHSNLSYFLRGKPTLTIPRTIVEKYSYIDRGNTYGIGVWLKHPAPEKIIVRNSQFDAGWFEQASRTKYGCDLFFPYFTERAMQALSQESED